VQALVVYESVFGNTAQIADQIGAGLRRHLSVRVVEVEDAPQLVDGQVWLVVLGGPTHSVGMSRPKSRQQATVLGRNTGLPPEIGQREWLQGVRFTADASAATFDTRLQYRSLPGRPGPGAAAGAQVVLRHKGLHLLAAPQSFFVRGTEGPLLIGERERALNWGEELARLLLERI
jgi:hypothetical protein